MNNYEKPIVLANSELSEGVYAASGTYGFNNASAYIHQDPTAARTDYRLQVDAWQKDGQESNRQTVTLTFNQPVTITQAGGQGGNVISGNGTNTVTIEYTYHQNSTEGFGFGDLYLTSEEGLEVLGASSEYH